MKILEILQEAASNFQLWRHLNGELETSIQPLKKPTANHLPVILKSNTETRFNFFLNFSPSSPAYSTIYRIISGFLNATTSILKRVSVRILKILSAFMKSSKNLNFHFLHNRAPKKFKNHRRIYIK
jgi:hypothetical protein